MTATEFILGVLGLLLSGGTVVALINFYANRKKIKAETDNLIVDGAKKLVRIITDKAGRVGKTEQDAYGTGQFLESASRDKDNRIKALEDENLEKSRRIKEQDKQISILREKLNKAIFDAREATQARQDRIQKIVHLEAQIEDLQGQIKKIEKKTGSLNGE